MVQLDLEKLAAGLGKGNASVIDSLGMSFGIPKCALDFTEDVLGALFPSNALGILNSSLQEGKEWAQGAVADIIDGITLGSGIIEYDTENGRLVFKSSASSLNLDIGEGALNDVVGTFGKILGAGAELYDTVQNISDQIDEILSCFDTLSNTFKFSAANSAALIPGTPEDVEAGLADYAVEDLPYSQQEVESHYLALKSEANEAINFIKKVEKTQAAIGRILLARSIDPSLEPCFFSNSVVDIPGDLGFCTF